MIQATRTPVKDINFSAETIPQWSIKSKNAQLRHDEAKALGTKHPSEIDALIDQIKNNTHTYQQRKRIALYIFSKLTT